MPGLLQYFDAVFRQRFDGVSWVTGTVPALQNLSHWRCSPNVLWKTHGVLA